MRCQECNAELDDDVLFCEKCGARISKDNSIASKLHFSKNRPAAAAEGTSGGFYSSTNKGKSTDANNSVVFDAKTIEYDVANIVIDKSEPVPTQQAPVVDDISVEAEEAPAVQSSDSEITLDLSGENSGTEEPVTEDLSADTSVTADDTLDFFAENSSAEELITPEVQVNSATSSFSSSSQAGAGGIAAMIQKAMNNAGTDGASSEPVEAVQESPVPDDAQQTSVAEEMADIPAQETENQPEERPKTEENESGAENNEGDDDIAGTFTYLAGAAERQINAFLGCAAGALVLLVLAVVTTDFIKVLMAILGAGCFGYAFYVTPKVIEATVNALVKGEGYYFIEYVNEISKYMKTAVIPVGAGMALLLVAMILGWCDHDYGAKYVTLLSMFAMAGGFAVSGVCAARFAVTNKIFEELASGNKPKKNYSDVINYVAAGVVFVIVILSAVMAA